MNPCLIQPLKSQLEPMIIKNNVEGYMENTAIALLNLNHIHTIHISLQKSLCTLFVQHLYFNQELRYWHETFMIWSFGSTKYIHVNKDDPVLQVYGLKQSRSFIYPSSWPPHFWHTFHKDINTKLSWYLPWGKIRSTMTSGMTMSSKSSVRNTNHPPSMPLLETQFLTHFY